MNDFDSYNQFDPDNGPEYPIYPPQPPVKPKKRGSGRIVALALCFSLLGGALGAGGVLAIQAMKPESPKNAAQVLESQRPPVELQIIPVTNGKVMTPAEVYAANVSSTVGITTSVTTNYWGFPTTSAASGSGFLITADGYILTNHHVIDGSDAITVTLYSGESYPAALIGYDESNDIAVLKIQAENLRPVVLGNSNHLNVGDSVMAIGNPLGELTFSLTAGLVSAKDRQVTFSGGVTMNLIQTDTAINSGNSGGALFNQYGEVVGVTNAKYSGSSSSSASIDNIGFAIPINSIRSIVDSIIEKGYVSKPYIGLSVSNVGSESQLYGLPAGAAVREITPDSPAEKSGLQVGDIITHADGMALTGSTDLVSRVRACQPGDTLELTVYRQGESLNLSVTIAEQRQEALPAAQPRQQSQQSWPFYGGIGR